MSRSFPPALKHDVVAQGQRSAEEGGREAGRENVDEQSTKTWGNLVAVADMCDHGYLQKLEGE